VDSSRPVPERSSDAAADRPTVLVVDDSPVVLHVLQIVFESAQYDVVTATGGTEALVQVDRCRPDIIITDVAMPDGDGFGLLRKIRENPATSTIPVIMLTASGPGGQPVVDPGALQPDGVVRKGGGWSDLLALARRLLHRRDDS
jgi:CheY-like chemotaxis protein